MRNYKIIDFAVPADHRIELKECEKKNKYLDLARELNKMWNMLVTIIPIVIGAFGTVTKRLLKGMEDLEVGGWVNTIQTTALLRTVRILGRVLEIWGDLLSLKPQLKTISISWCEKNYNNNNYIQLLEDYIEKLEGGLITATRNYTDNTIDNRMTLTRKQLWEEKQLNGRFKRRINNSSHLKTWTWQRKRHFKRETETLQIAAQIKDIRTNQIVARIDKTQQNSKCRLCGDRDETINHIITKCSKLAQKEYKTRKGDSLGDVQEIYFWPYEQIVYAQPSISPGVWHTQTSIGLWHRNGSPNLGQKSIPRIINKKRELAKLSTLLTSRKLKENEKKDKYLELLGNWNNHRIGNYTNRNWCILYSNLGIIKGTG